MNTILGLWEHSLLDPWAAMQEVWLLVPSWRDHMESYSNYVKKEMCWFSFSSIWPLNQSAWDSRHHEAEVSEHHTSCPNFRFVRNMNTHQSFKLLSCVVVCYAAVENRSILNMCTTNFLFQTKKKSYGQTCGM